MGTIVVGVDGSEESRHALRRAVDEARLRDAAVEAVYAYEYTPAWRTYAYGDEAMAPGQYAEMRRREAEEAEHAQQRAQALVERMVAEVGDPQGVSVEPVAVEDRRPARALVERAAKADMLVVGSRGRGGFAGLVLGSVSQQCAQHAQCPLLILPRPQG